MYDRHRKVKEFWESKTAGEIFLWICEGVQEQKKLIKETKIGQSTVSEYLGLLEREGLIISVKQQKRGYVKKTRAVAWITKTYFPDYSALYKRIGKEPPLTGKWLEKEYTTEDTWEECERWFLPLLKHFIRIIALDWLFRKPNERKVSFKKLTNLFFKYLVFNNVKIIANIKDKNRKCFGILSLLIGEEPEYLPLIEDEKRIKELLYF